MHHQTQPNTPEQEDKLGTKIMRAFHGTNNDFDTFSLDFLGQYTDDNASSEALALSSHLGIWFTSNAEYASQVYDKVLECEITIENPMEVESLESLEYWIESQGKTAEELRDMIMDWGYDGIVIAEDEEFGGTSVIALTPGQVSII